MQALIDIAKSGLIAVVIVCGLSIIVGIVAAIIIRKNRKKKGLIDENIIGTIIVACGTTTSKGKAVFRGVVDGQLFGPMGAITGMLSAMGKDIVKFKVFYNNRLTNIETVEVGSSRFNFLCQFLQER